MVMRIINIQDIKKRLKYVLKNSNYDFNYKDILNIADFNKVLPSTVDKLIVEIISEEEKLERWVLNVTSSL